MLEKEIKPMDLSDAMKKEHARVVSEIRSSKNITCVCGLEFNSSKDFIEHLIENPLKKIGDVIHREDRALKESELEDKIEVLQNLLEQVEREKEEEISRLETKLFNCNQKIEFLFSIIKTLQKCIDKEEPSKECW